MNEQALTNLARAIIDEISYMTLGTADENGLPWVSPVWFASDEYHEFFWVSSPERRHSRNIAARPEVAIVIFDSRVPISTGQAVYMSAVAEEATGSDVERGIQVFSRRSEAEEARPWGVDDVSGQARLRLYRAAASEHFVLGAQDERIPVDLGH